MPSLSSPPPTSGDFRALLVRLDARDRRLFARLALDAGAVGRRSRYWLGLTHLGGARATIALSLLSLCLGIRPAVAAFALVALGLSHGVVRVIKRFAARPRPLSTTPLRALIAAPDRFSFPSGHACSAMSLAICFSLAFPILAAPLVLLAIMVGASRVVLGVHYPGDIVVGQLIAVVTAMLLRPVFL